MDMYKVENLSYSELCETNKYSFFMKRQDDRYDVFSKGLKEGVQFKFLSNDMGTHSDEYLEIFLNDMKEVSKEFIVKGNEFYFISVLMLLIFLDVNNSGDLLKGGYAYVSHVQGFFTFFKKYEGIKEYYEKKYQENHVNIEKIYKKYLEVKLKNIWIYREVRDIIENLKVIIRPDIENNNIHFLKYKESGKDMDGLLYKSKFHKKMGSGIDFEDIEFKINRFILICEYFFLKNMGLSYKDRTFMCFCIYRYIEEIYNFSYDT
ncbi:Uncharacterised protein [Streptococcus pseudoporcinus]|uniref:Uncharacterized protein n=1 Tax=Streptococcus pseudoporcinus TaxID=361101 RepID=A0A4U9YS79_9STRE|nr:hypothetical protein [Streptococcus pseudoporcinus]VTS29885.1 Uncharacterised protein [Streptococcus pseudoporcinus]